MNDFPLINKETIVPTFQTPDPVVEVICSGTPWEMGFAQGKALRDRIHAARGILFELESFRLKQPWYLPFKTYRWIAERKSMAFLKEPMNRDFPQMKERLAGIAEGAKASLQTIYLFNALEPLLSSISGSTAAPGACSAVCVRGQASSTGQPILVRNFDYLPLIQPYYLVRECRPKGKFRSIEFTTVPLAGAVDGMNEKGLAIAYDYAFGVDQPQRPSAPISMAISGALENCATVTEASEFICRQNRWGAGLLMLTDSSGDIASLELSSTRSFLRRPGSGENHLFHSNAFRSETMREIQIPDDAIYTNAAPTPLRGRRCHQSSDLRDKRFRELLSGRSIFSPTDLEAIMSDHGPDGVPSDFTPCVHGSYWQTTACLQFYPETLTIRVAYDNACKAKYREVRLEKS